MQRSLFAIVMFAGAVCAVGDPNTCLVLSGENLARGPGNWFLYVELASQPYTFVAGDQLEYDILLPAHNPELKGGLDADLRGGERTTGGTCPACLRDSGVTDQTGIRLHGDGVLTPARDQWYHRRFDLTPFAGCTAARWQAVFEGDAPGKYVQCLADVRITRDGQNVATIYAGGPAPEPRLTGINGYSRTLLLTTAPRGDVLNNGTLDAVLVGAQVQAQLRAARDEFRTELALARELSTAAGGDAAQSNALIDAAAADEDRVAYDARDQAKYLNSLTRARQRLAPLKPPIKGLTAHLVGHAHIDFQWLWSWDETVNQIIPQTFGQALKFMDEFPDFTFAQSSAALYLATEEEHPALFKQIQEYARAGRWEPVGGRWCEGDLNMIAPESHVRHFLYAQRYFQQKLGRLCTEGWEPDTFGHPWTMPQILKKAGLRSYYFCRGGADPPGHAGAPPIFWWEGPDGSRVLAFDGAQGGWYGGSVSDARVQQFAAFVRQTGLHDELLVYGVGNHGGGPTRENLEAARDMRGRELWPTIKFSTLAAFWDRVYAQTDGTAARGADAPTPGTDATPTTRPATAARLPTVRAELNPVFEGCYTTHSRTKKHNRDSESLLVSAEVFAALAALNGTPYPRADIEQLWRDVLWNHHHDTLCGSCVHASALYSAQAFEALLKRGRELLATSRQSFTDRMAFATDAATGGEARSTGPCVVVFNPLAWSRSEVVEATLQMPAATTAVALTDEQGAVPTQLLDRRVAGDVATLRVCLAARSVPGCGYKAFGVKSVTATPLATAPLPMPPWPSAARFQMLHEAPDGSSAWSVGKIDQTIDLDRPVSAETLERGPVRWRVRHVYEFGKSRITQDTLTYAGRQRVEYETVVDWNEVGNPRDGSHMLKVAFATGLDVETATYDIPFGDVARKNDGHENVALKWCDLSGAPAPTGGATSAPAIPGPLSATGVCGVTVLNDCKHGYDVQSGVVRLTLLRSSSDPDPAPDVGTHQMRYAVVPHAGPLDKAAAARAAWEFNQPLQCVVLQTPPARPTPSGALPPTWSGCQVEPGNVILTALKLAEDSDDLILRAYECSGQRVVAKFALGFAAKSAAEVDLLERALDAARPVQVDGQTLTAEFTPYEIRTIRVRR